MLELTKEEYKVWLDNPITEKIMYNLRERRELYCKALSDGVAFFADSAARTHAGTAKILGILEGLDIILNQETGAQDE